MANKQELKLKSPMEAHMDGKMETKLRYKAILALVKEHKEAIQEKHKEELNVVEIQSKLSILDQLEPIFGSIMDEREKLVSDLQLAQARMNDVVFLLLIGTSWMNLKCMINLGDNEARSRSFGGGFPDH
ncbi:Uncharacterized protein Rs2_21406 [Raphanus sativus]|nr:Uncharacterized protein Rs2_21406 [Raphanus sativus]